MPLSEHEQRLLEQIERALYAEDPKFASTVRGAKLRRPSRRRRLQGAALFVLGLVLLVVGMVVPVQPAGIPVISVLGFLVMFGGAVLTLATLGKGDPGADNPADTDDEVKGQGRRRSSFAQRMEERFRRRFDGE
ncbi:membrane protein [Longimycelium tulufanense]|uniref:Membrane protein n=1 Tax=Longimycelium tulufanense TaxID=907463 RepID=A0A8J3CA83_9PSEU|nr:DUF3040 domain-containing protein [Longimycelium tulufanense]GGM37960.1 membrane protein [Longimycelium tulufanense]